MGIMFDQEWLNGFSTRWNSTREMTEPLGQAKFCSVIGFGLQDDERPRIRFHVEDGRITNTSLVQSGDTTIYNWDLRATPEQWDVWRKEPLTIMSLGPAVAQGKPAVPGAELERLLERGFADRLEQPANGRL